MLKKILRAILGSPRPPKQPFCDPVLGTLTPGETCWEVEVDKRPKADQVIRFEIAGDSRPAEVLLAHARDIVSDLSVFQRRIQQFLDNEKDKFPPEAASEIEALQLQWVCLFWPHRPDDGMIFFVGPQDELRNWRCDYIARQPMGLGFDT
jgi:hypothetical protein